jgi:penicillin-insensitive murein endopeptidase
MIERAARGVARRHPGSVLELGDLSRRGGGEVRGHSSHESGRDADLGLYAVDAKGKQIHARTFVRFDSSLRSTNVRGARFDAARNWLLVQHLLTDPRARVSHIFIADPLRQALIAEAKRRGVSRALLTRAQLAMMQPSGAEPHDDHMHVRISCPRADAGRCVELAKDAPMGQKRARNGRPARAERAQKERKGAPAARAATARAPRARTERRRDAPPPAARGASQVPMMLDAIDEAVLRGEGLGGAEAASGAGLSRGEPEAEADGAEVRDAIDDESGAPKITD